MCIYSGSLIFSEYDREIKRREDSRVSVTASSDRKGVVIVSSNHRHLL